MGDGNVSRRRSGMAKGKILGLVLLAIILAVIVFQSTRQPKPPSAKPIAKAPATETPVTETPATETPVTETPVTETPVTETPVTETPVTETPVTETPVVSTVSDADQEKPSDQAGKAKSDQSLAQQQAHGAPQALSGRQLYLRHCAGCHGEKGDGQGIAAQYLFPKPRDFRAGRFRLVSTTNGVPTLEDLDAVLQRGMPGSMMPPWKQLSREARRAIAEYVMQLRRDGLREDYTKLVVEEDELTKEELAEADVQQDIQEHVALLSTPGESSQVPEFHAPDSEAVARGKAVYMELKCYSCHGKEGKGDGAEKMVDAKGYPIRPNDYTRGIFKGGDDYASLYRRIRYGMPGTPMPSSSAVKPEQIVDLVHFLRSLSDEKTRQAAVLQRKELVVQSVEKIPTSTDDSQWATIKPTPLQTTPLWWRNDANPGLEVQAAHDGKTIAFRISWQDPTPDLQAVQSQAFEDAVALELYRGDVEPFLGMGSRDAPVDVWFWDADRQEKRDSIGDFYANAVVDIYPFSEKNVDTAEMNRPGVQTANQPDISLPAKASGNPIVPISAKSGASTLTAGGPGTSTFRMPKSQLVVAHGEWKDGRWSVLMTRSLAVESAAEGLSLKSGDRASIAFALWDGSHQERDGKKSITFWQDLILK